MRKIIIETLFLIWTLLIAGIFYYRYFVSYIYENKGAIERLLGILSN